MKAEKIFVDQACLKLLKRHYAEARNIIGKPMTDVLGIPAKVSQYAIGNRETGTCEVRIIDRR